MIGDIRYRIEGKGRHPVEELRKELQHLMWKKAGIIRTEEELLGLLDDIERLKEELAGSGVEGWKKLINKLETENMLLVGEAVAKSALLRKESRGAHYREDFPGEGGEQWNKSITQ
jgi:fumarate reductase (CoM/CoB) subunit A